MEKIRLSDEFLGVAHESSCRRNSSDVPPLFFKSHPKNLQWSLKNHCIYTYETYQHSQIIPYIEPWSKTNAGQN